MIWSRCLASERGSLEEFTHLPQGTWIAPHICGQTIDLPIGVWRHVPSLGGSILTRATFKMVVIHIRSSCVLYANPDAILTVGMGWGFSLN